MELTISKENKENAEAISTFSNPFSPNLVRKIEIEIYPTASSWRKGKKIEATVRFCKNDTDGSHKVYGDTLDEIIMQMTAVLQELK